NRIADCALGAGPRREPRRPLSPGLSAEGRSQVPQAFGGERGEDTVRVSQLPVASCQLTPTFLLSWSITLRGRNVHNPVVGRRPAATQQDVPVAGADLCQPGHV